METTLATRALTEKAQRTYRHAESTGDDFHFELGEQAYGVKSVSVLAVRERNR
ncbi:hypothetical protein EV652_1168 [Kribbella steppae]|uniref:Uncharacterized protein n=1 Tax=Kribbella steppae TaxID=2512223 RepID=A0A4R2H1V5_9ACTN|nr:hypothetical protein [Kribbella steppae]TCO17987.1 hypothetical protein EV652_1168 [Kribbella steppae]